MDELQKISPDTLRMERLLDAPVEKVWRWLVEPELRALWFAGGTASESTGEFELHFDHDRLSSQAPPYPPEYQGSKGRRVTERVLRVEAPRLLSYTWAGGKEGVVTFELFPANGKTRLVLTHSGITGPVPYGQFSGGWLSHLSVLQTKLAGGTVPDFWALHSLSKARVAELLGST